MSDCSTGSRTRAAGSLPRISRRKWKLPWRAAAVRGAAISQSEQSWPRARQTWRKESISAPSSRPIIRASQTERRCTARTCFPRVCRSCASWCSVISMRWRGSVMHWWRESLRALGSRRLTSPITTLGIRSPCFGSSTIQVIRHCRTMSRVGVSASTPITGS